MSGGVIKKTNSSEAQRRLPELAACNHLEPHAANIKNVARQAPGLASLRSHRIRRAHKSDESASDIELKTPKNSRSASPSYAGTRINGQRKSDSRNPDPSAIVVIHPREFIRDCFVRCLEISYSNHEIFSYASIDEWQLADDQGSAAPGVIVCFMDGRSIAGLADLQLLEAVASRGIPIIVMSDVDDAHHVTRAFQIGARGYVPTSLPFNVVVEIVRLVEAGGTFVPASSLSLERNGIEAKSTDLTDRQRMVVEALCQGMANKQIAYELNMSEHTVKIHLRHIMRKLNVRNRTEVAVRTRDFL